MKQPRYMSARELGQALTDARRDRSDARAQGAKRTAALALADIEVLQAERRRRDPKGHYR
jgi:hypothetical protein